MAKDEALLEEIRENFEKDLAESKDIRDEGNRDRVMIADGPWSDKERKAREDPENPRPCESFDELDQYLNQAFGDMRQNKRAVKVTPTGDGANDQTAEKRAGMIRQIEYDSNAQTAYATAFECMAKGSYGFIKLGSRYRDPAKGFDQVLYVGSVPNPDTILVDPYAKNPDWSDMDHAYEIDSYSKKEFEKKWPEAEHTGFDAADMTLAPLWIRDRIQVASYWKLEKKQRKQVQIDIGQGPMDVYVDEIPGARVVGNNLVIKNARGEEHAVPLLNMRKCEVPSVCQYVTNGIEILETNPQKWLEIPIIPLFGPEEFVDTGAGAKRRLRSMVRKARGAYMGYCYARTTELEVLGMSPKIIYLGYEGQFDTNTPWAKINKSNLPYGTVKARTTATGAETLPLPIRQPYDPPIQSLEMAAASFRLAIQTAMSVGGMLNGQKSQNADAKSGKAIEALDRQENQGTYIFVSNYERAIARVGRQLEQGLGWCYDAPTEVGLRAADETYSQEKINQVDAKGQPIGFHTSTGDHATTISVGPNDDSTRDAANDFAETLMNIPGIPPKVLALCVRLRNLGPIGDQIAEAIDPNGDEAIPPAVAQHMAQSNEMVQKLTAEVHKLAFQLEAKVPELQSRERMHAQDLDFKREQLAVEASIGAAKIGSTEAIERLDIETQLIANERGAAAEAAENDAARGHEAGLQGAAQAHEQAQQESAQGHQASLAASGQAADAASQDSAQQHAAEQSLQQQSADSQDE